MSLRARHLIPTLFCFCWPPPCDGADPPFAVTVSAGKHDRAGTLVETSLAVSPGVQAAAGSHAVVFRLERDGGRGAVLAQWTADTLVFRIEEPLAAGETRTYRSGGTVRPTGDVDRVRCRHRGGSVSVLCGDRSVLAYNTGIVRCPDREHRAYDRTGYLHPVWTPAGAVITDDFPPDERHQRGLFLAWRRFEWGDRAGDFWSIKSQDASLRHESVESIASGPVFGEFVVRNRGVISEAKSGAEHHVLDERWRVRVYDIGETGHLFDLHIRHRAMTHDLKVSKMNWGGLAYRGPVAWFESPPDVLTSEGRDRRGGDGQPARWCRYGGTLAGRPVSITIFDHSDNPRYPEQLLRIHPARPYFCFPVSRSGAFTIATGKPLELRYRVYVTDRICEAAELEALARDFVEPPVVKVR